MADKFDLKTFLLNIAPVIATGLGGPLAGTAVSVLSNAITGKPNTPQAELEALVSKGLNPEQLAAITQANNDFELAMSCVSGKRVGNKLVKAAHYIRYEYAKSMCTLSKNDSRYDSTVKALNAEV